MKRVRVVAQMLAKDKIVFHLKSAILILGGLKDHAKTELGLAGLFDKDSDYDGMIGKAVMELVDTFASQGHSGFSAQWVLEVFNEVAQFKPLTPITSNSDEWEDVARYGDGSPLWQNKRAPMYFSEDGGKNWYDVNEI